MSSRSQGISKKSHCPQVNDHNIFDPIFSQPCQEHLMSWSSSRSSHHRHHRARKVMRLNKTIFFGNQLCNFIKSKQDQRCPKINHINVKELPNQYFQKHHKLKAICQRPCVMFIPPPQRMLIHFLGSSRVVLKIKAINTMNNETKLETMNSTNRVLKNKVVLINKGPWCNAAINRQTQTIKLNE